MSEHIKKNINEPKQRKTTAKGYIRLHRNKKGIFEHILIWEKHHGGIPDGMQIHHKDFDKTNNNIENLQLISPIEHKRLHEGCMFIGNEWYKPCKDCEEYKKCDNTNWYFSRGWINGRLCKKCYIKKSLETRKILIDKGWKRKNYQIKNQSKKIF